MKTHRSFAYFKEIFFYLIIIIFSLAFFKILSPFFIDILLAAVLVNFFKKTNVFISRKLHNRRRAALISVLLITVIFAIPLFITGLMVSAEATSFYEIVKSRWSEYSILINNENIKTYLAKIPFVGNKFKTLEFSDYSGKLVLLGQSALQVLLLILKQTFFSLTAFVAHFFITIFLSYYLFLDGKSLINKISALLPLKNAEENRFVTELVKITDALILNTVLVGIGEGIFGGILFTIVGIPSPFFWGVIMFLLSMIPVVGATTILLPAAVIQLLMGNYIAGLTLLIIGVGGITINQNIIKPKLDGKRSGLHPAVVFLATMGGLLWLGMIGFLVGPLIAAMFIVTWNLVGERYNEEYKVQNNEDKPKTSPKESVEIEN